MKYAIGLMACIAIVFCVITSPQNAQSYASPQAEQHAAITHQAMLEQSVQAMTAAIADLQESIAGQQERIEQQVETKLVAFTSSLPVQDTDETWSAIRDLDDKQAELERRVAELEAEREKLQAAQVKVAAIAPVVSSGSTGSTGSVTAYTPRWQNYDGLSKEQHAQQMHGINTTGMSAAEIAMALDHDHDINGPGHPHRSRATVVTRPTSSDPCPGGICPTTRTTVRQTSGWFLGKNLGRR